MQKLVLRDVIPPKSVSELYVEEESYLGVRVGTAEDFRRAQADHWFCYWRMLGRGGQDLLTLDLDRSNGRLFGVELMLYKGRIGRVSRSSRPMHARQGIVMFDQSRWTRTNWVGVRSGGSEEVDVREDFLVELGDQELRFRLFPDAIHGVVEVSDQVTCEFNSRSELCAVVLSVPSDQRAAVRKVLMK